MYCKFTGPDLWNPPIRTLNVRIELFALGISIDWWKRPFPSIKCLPSNRHYTFILVWLTDLRTVAEQTPYSKKLLGLNLPAKRDLSMQRLQVDPWLLGFPSWNPVSFQWHADYIYSELPIGVSVSENGSPWPWIIYINNGWDDSTGYNQSIFEDTFSQKLIVMCLCLTMIFEKLQTDK